MTLQEHLQLKKNIESKGLKLEYRKHAAYYNKMARKGFITREDQIKTMESTLIILGR